VYALANQSTWVVYALTLNYHPLSKSIVTYSRDCEEKSGELMRLHGLKMRVEGLIRENRRPRALKDPAPEAALLHWSVRRINTLVKSLPAASTYLEIGVQHGSTLESIKIPFKWGVEPHPLFRLDSLPAGMRIFHGNSDDFFQTLNGNVAFDVVFLDGLHDWRQTYRDLVNTLNHSHSKTVILIDDVVPNDQYSALPIEREALEARLAAGLPGLEWHGDVYKVILAIRDLHPNLDFRVIENGADNPQAIIWQKDVGHPHAETKESVLQEYSHIAYHDVFVGGETPPYFNVRSEGSAIEEVLTSLRTHESR
jgi:hypothetical protein